MANFELNPGKFTPESQTGNFYFSCDTGTSVLVGTKQRYIDAPNKIFSTCPILGISLIYNSTTPRFINATSEYEHKYPEWLLRLGEMVVSPLPYRKPTDSIAGISAKMRARPSTPSLETDGVGIGFILTCEWNWLCDRYSVAAGYNPNDSTSESKTNPEIFPGKPRAIDYDVDPEGFGPWICLLFTEVGLYELHCDME